MTLPTGCVCDPDAMEWDIEGRRDVCDRFEMDDSYVLGVICRHCEHDEQCHAEKQRLFSASPGNQVKGLDDNGTSDMGKR